MGSGSPGVSTRGFAGNNSEASARGILAGGLRPQPKKVAMKPGEIPFVYETAVKLLCWSLFAYDYEPEVEQHHSS